MLGHGRSTWGDPASWSFERAADAVRDFCATVGLAKPVVYGHSLGGMVAMLYGARHPGHARALVLQSAMGRVDVLDQLGAIDAPTLVCVGALDPVTPVAAHRELVAALPTGLARLEILEGAGHFAWKDVPETYWPLLTEFVTTV